MSEENAPIPSSGLADKVRRGRPPRVRQETHEPEREPQGRAKRIPLGSQRLKLLASTRAGFVRRWINDNNSRVQMALQAGYEFVRRDGGATTTDMGESVSQIVGTKEGGAPQTAYLMEIREEWHQEDQAIKQSDIDAKEHQIRRGELVGKVGQDGVYLPSRGIKVKRDTKF